MGLSRVDEWYASGKEAYAKFMGRIDERASLVWRVISINWHVENSGGGAAVVY